MTTVVGPSDSCSDAPSGAIIGKKNTATNRWASDRSLSNDEISKLAANITHAALAEPAPSTTTVEGLRGSVSVTVTVGKDSMQARVLAVSKLQQMTEATLAWYATLACSVYGDDCSRVRMWLVPMSGDVTLGVYTPVFVKLDGGSGGFRPDTDVLVNGGGEKAVASCESLPPTFDVAHQAIDALKELRAQYMRERRKLSCFWFDNSEKDAHGKPVLQLSGRVILQDLAPSNVVTAVEMALRTANEKPATPLAAHNRPLYVSTRRNEAGNNVQYFRLLDFSTCTLGPFFDTSKGVTVATKAEAEWTSEPLL